MPVTDPTADYSSNQCQPAPRVPDFEFIRPIGQGGFGQVWLATNRATGHLRAVKVIPLGSPGTTDPAGREITSITRLEESVHTHHPNLLEIQHVGKTGEHLYYVMEPADDVSGGRASAESGYRPATLQSRLEGGPLGQEECWRYARELLTGLAYLHAAGMVHRDVKPANCLLVGGQLKLADFGLLAEADPQVSRVGTQKYMPPDGRMDTRADVYAAGLVIYEILSGLPVESFPRLGQRGPQIAQSATMRRLNRLVLRACQPDPGQRFQDAREMLRHLAAPEGEAGGRGARLRRRIVFSAGVALAMIVLGAVGLWTARPAYVDVNFITEPYEATIYLNQRQQFKPDGTPYTTPCTIESLPARVHRVQFKYQGQPRRDAGEIDFAKVRQITAKFESGQPLGSR
jgi:serine/threonine protein kinase